jgi:bacillithiol system protein YtxJ
VPQWEADMNDIDLLYVDLIRHPRVSQEVTEETGVRHESPQIIAIKGKEVVGSTSHMNVSLEWAKRIVEQNG